MKSLGTAKGFTIVELVVVIVILGILAAVALPRFMDASERAHDSAVIATKGALAESVALFKAQWFVNGNSQGDPENNVDGFGNGDVDSNGSGWPICMSLTTATSPAGLEDCVTESVELTGAIDAEMCADVWEGLLGAQGPSALVTPTADTEYAVSASTTRCIYTYLPDPESDSLNTSFTPAITPVGSRGIVYDTSNGQVTTNVIRFSEEGS